MTDPERRRPAIPGAPGPGFYGWRIVGVAFLVDFIAVGFYFYSYGVFLKEIAAELGEGSRLGVSLGLSISGAVGSLASPFVGNALDRFSIKRIMIVGACCVSAGFGLLSRIDAYWQFYLVLATLLGLGMTMMGGLASSKLVANWFVARRGTALGIATMGVSLSGLSMPLVATWLIATLGWRGGFVVYAVCTFAVVTPLVARFAVDRPEAMGLRPDGDAPEPPGSPPPVPEPVWHTRDILGSRDFWLIALPFALVLAALSAILTHLVPYADDLGIAGFRAAAILSLAAGLGAVGKLSFGWLFDRAGGRIAVWISFLTQIAGLLLILNASAYSALLAGGAVFGFGMGGVIPLHGAVAGAAFGRLSFGKVMGLLRPVQMPIHSAGVPLAGWIYDTTGSYELAFQLFVGIYVLASLAVAGISLRPAAFPTARLQGAGDAGASGG